MKKKAVFFFGAGAEAKYGMPLGGEFALEIFRQNTQPGKQRFKKEIASIDPKGIEANSWLPRGYEKKPVSSFGKSQYEALLSSSLEYKRKTITDYLDDFDSHCEKVLRDFMRIKTTFDVKLHFKSLHIDISEESYGNSIAISEKLGKTNKLFEAEYFSGLLRLLEIDENGKIKCGIDEENYRNIREIAKCFVEFLVGSMGRDLVNDLNDNLFDKKPDNIDLFDDIGGFFTLDYAMLGMSGFSMILDKKCWEDRKSDLESRENIDSAELIFEFYLRVLEILVAKLIDYQSLIDTNFRYIYQPFTDWAKFSKISIFLYNVRDYISRQYLNNKTRILDEKGYYDQLNEQAYFDVLAIGTSNYNLLIKEKLANYSEDIFYLNGCVEEYYDPYRNKIVNESESCFKVPFLFTQSGIKPLTSIKISERYVDFYQRARMADVIISCGFGFNVDDSHINGIFRTLVEDDNKHLIILDRYDSHKSEEQQKKHFQKCLRLRKNTNLTVVFVDNDLMVRSGDKAINWVEYLVSLVPVAEPIDQKQAQ